MKSIIKSAKTVEEAVELGLREIGLSRDEVEIEIIEEATKGLFGIFGGSDAIVKIKEKKKMKIDINIDDIFADTRFASLNDELDSNEEDDFDFEEDDEDDLLDLFEEEVEDKVEVVEQKEVVEVIQEVSYDEDFEDTKDLEDYSEEENYETYEEEEDFEVIESEESSLVNTRDLVFSGVAEVINSEDDAEIVAKKVKKNLENILIKMHIESKVSYSIDEGNTINLNLSDISENDTGIVIGNKGETLNAIQYVLSLLTNKNASEYYRITLNVADYRDRRKKSIEANAQKVAYKVLKTKRSIALKPMNSYERRIVHTALQNYKNIETVSIGKFPNRKVVVKYLGQ